MRARLEYWKSIGCDDKVLTWIAYGKTPSFHDPDEVQNLAFPNPKSARAHAAFVEKECQGALDNGSAVRVDYSFARVIDLILVSQKEKRKARLMP